VLLSRVDGDGPPAKNRLYVQPSQPIAVKQFDIIDPKGIRRTYELGRQDGAAFALDLRPRGLSAGPVEVHFALHKERILVHLYI
jgi:hypothetical protein